MKESSWIGIWFMFQYLTMDVYNVIALNKFIVLLQSFHLGG